MLLSYTEGQVDESQSSENRKAKLPCGYKCYRFIMLFSVTVQVVG